MKKLCIIAVLSMITFTSVEAQGTFNGGIHLGIPVGDVSDFSGFNMGVDLSYLMEIADGLEAGFATGYSHFTGKDVDFGEISFEAEDFGFIPLAGTARYGFSDQVFGALDLGYAISTNGGTGGFYYQPKVGYIAEMMDIFAFYKGISANGGTVASFGVGAAYRFN
tara:strand:+ start:46156 stop:46650 length:495 start_codon:yes stop_codon:yes gene_type:complete